MYCTHCGKEIGDARYCIYCGKAQFDGLNSSLTRPPANSVYADARSPIIRIIKRHLAMVGLIIGALLITAVAVTAGYYTLPILLNKPDVTQNQADVPGKADGPQSEKMDADPITKLADATKGDLIAFGRYPQDNANDSQDIVWIVLAVDGNDALLLSQKVLDCKPISASISTNYDITWKKSDIHAWLNDGFLNSFEQSELQAIDTTEVKQSRDASTEDMLFLLSADEFDANVPSKWAQAQATRYARDNGIHTLDNNGNANWWLRDYNPRKDDTSDDNHFLNVFTDGTINTLGYLATHDNIGIRPALWINLSGKGHLKSNSAMGGEVTDTGEAVNAPVKKTQSQPGGTTVSLQVKTADGQPLTGTVRRDASGYVIADSSTKEYSLSELKALNLSDAELCIAWNEPFARQGYHFKNPDLRSYFEACSWYTDSSNAANLTGAAEVNNERLREIAEQSDSARRWKDLATN